MESNTKKIEYWKRYKQKFTYRHATIYKTYILYMHYYLLINKLCEKRSSVPRRKYFIQKSTCCLQVCIFSRSLYDIKVANKTDYFLDRLKDRTPAFISCVDVRRLTIFLLRIGNYSERTICLPCAGQIWFYEFMRFPGYSNIFFNYLFTVQMDHAVRTSLIFQILS